MTENDPKLEREVFEILGGDIRCTRCHKLPNEQGKRYKSDNYIYGEVWQEGVICPDCHQEVCDTSPHYNSNLLFKRPDGNWGSTNDRWWVCVGSTSDIVLGGNTRKREKFTSILALYDSKSWKELTK